MIFPGIVRQGGVNFNLKAGLRSRLRRIYPSDFLKK